MARQTDKPQYLLRQTHFWKSSGKKVFKNAGILHIFKCASRHSRVSFFNIGSSKSGPYPSVFSHFDLQRRFAPQWRAIFPDRKLQNRCRNEDLQMRLAPQWRAIFPNRIFKNGSSPEVFGAFWLAHVLRATAACHFSVLRSTATSAPAAFASLLFEHPESQIIEKTQGFATFRTCGACVSSFYWLFSRVDLLSTGLTSLLCFSTVWLDFSTLLFNCPYWIVGN